MDNAGILRISERADKTLELAELMAKMGDGSEVSKKAHLKLAIMAACGDSEMYGYEFAKGGIIK